MISHDETPNYGSGIPYAQVMPNHQQQQQSPVYGAASNISTCRMTQQQLEKHLSASRHGEDQNIFNSYFVPMVFPPRCVACERLIAEHDQQQQQQHKSPVGWTNNSTAVPVTEWTGTGPHDPQMQEEDGGNRLVYDHVNKTLKVFFWVGLVVGLIGIIVIIVLIAAGVAQRSPTSVLGVLAPLIIGITFTSLATRVKLQFFLSDRRVKYERSKLSPLLWCCCGDSGEFSFDEVVAVTERNTSTTVNDELQVDILLNLRGGRTHELGMVGMYESTQIRRGWEGFFRCKCGVALQ